MTNFSKVDLGDVPSLSMVVPRRRWAVLPRRPSITQPHEAESSTDQMSSGLLKIDAIPHVNIAARAPLSKRKFCVYHRGPDGNPHLF